MRIQLYITCIAASIISGCFSVYNINDFSSRQKFIEDINMNLKHKPVKVYVNTDSIIYGPAGMEILGDTAIVGVNLIKNERKLQISEIDSFRFFEGPEKEQLAFIKLKSGKDITAENVIKKDSTLEFTSIAVDYKNIPLNIVKKVSYKNHWLGVPARALIGMVISFAGSALISEYRSVENIDYKNSINPLFPMAFGSVIGGIIGYIFGYEYTYEFN